MNVMEPFFNTINDRLADIAIQKRIHESAIAALDAEAKGILFARDSAPLNVAPAELKAPDPAPARTPRGPNAKPSNLTASHILNAIGDHNVSENHIFVRCKDLGSEPKVIAATFKDMLKNNVIRKRPDGAIERVPEAKAAE